MPIGQLIENIKNVAPENLAEIATRMAEIVQPLSKVTYHDHPSATFNSVHARDYAGYCKKQAWYACNMQGPCLDYVVQAVKNAVSAADYAARAADWVDGDLAAAGSYKRKIVSCLTEFINWPGIRPRN